MLKSKLENLLAVALIFLLITGWVFSGWPKIWRSPPIPPEIRQTAAATETQYPSAAITTAVAPYDDVDWDAGTAPNVGTDDATYAVAGTAKDLDAGIYTYVLKATNYGFSIIPSGATINGIVVEHERFGAKCSDALVQLIKGGTLQGDNKSAAAVWPAAEEITTFGSSTDLWGLTWSDTEIKASDFGVAVAVVGSIANAIGSIDFLRITVYYTVANNEPTVNSVNLTPHPITVNENSTTTATCTATITDLDGGDKISYATGTIYRSGAGSSCSSDNNYCYPNIVCSLSAQAGNNKYATCTADIWFHADPTDAGTYEGDTWQCYVIAGDDQGATGNNTDGDPPELNTLNALIVTNSIDYGTLAPGATSSASQIITATTTGNAAIDVNISGTDMATSSYSFSISYQEYATSSVDYGSGTDASNTATTLVLESGKPTTHPSDAADDIYWRIGIPAGQELGTYYGTTTIAAKAK